MADRTTTMLVKAGHESAVVIDQHFLDLLGITPDTRLEVQVEHGAIVVTSLDAKEARSRRIDEALRKVNAQYGNAMRRLARGPDTTDQA